MANKELKKIMTDLAAGHITQEEADMLIKSIKVAEDKPEDETEGKKHIIKKTQKRKLNAKGGKK